MNRLYKCLPPCAASAVPALKNVRVSRKYVFNRASSLRVSFGVLVLVYFIFFFFAVSPLVQFIGI